MCARMYRREHNAAAAQRDSFANKAREAAAQTDFFLQKKKKKGQNLRPMRRLPFANH